MVRWGEVIPSKNVFPKVSRTSIGRPSANSAWHCALRLWRAAANSSLLALATSNTALLLAGVVVAVVVAAVLLAAAEAEAEAAEEAEAVADGGRCSGAEGNVRAGLRVSAEAGEAVAVVWEGVCGSSKPA